MTSIVHTSAASPRCKAVKELKRDLSGHSTLSWERILENLQLLNPNEEERLDLVTLVATYVNTATKYGQFGNLRGIEPVLKYLGIENIGFSRETIDKIRSLYSKYSYCKLMELFAPTTWSKQDASGKWRTTTHDGKEYRRVPYARARLKESGASPEELTDEYINGLSELWQTLIELHNKMRGRELPEDPKKITEILLLPRA